MGRKSCSHNVISAQCFEYQHGEIQTSAGKRRELTWLHQQLLEKVEEHQSPRSSAVFIQRAPFFNKYLVAGKPLEPYSPSAGLEKAGVQLHVP